MSIIWWDTRIGRRVGSGMKTSLTRERISYTRPIFSSARKIFWRRGSRHSTKRGCSNWPSFSEPWRRCIRSYTRTSTLSTWCQFWLNSDSKWTKEAGATSPTATTMPSSMHPRLSIIRKHPPLPLPPFLSPCFPYKKWKRWKASWGGSCWGMPSMAATPFAGFVACTAIARKVNCEIFTLKLARRAWCFCLTSSVSTIATRLPRWLESICRISQNMPNWLSWPKQYQWSNLYRVTNFCVFTCNSTEWLPFTR